MQCTKPAAARSIGVDVLRGIAVLAVVLCHAPFSMQALGGTAAGDAAYPPAPWTDVLRFGEYGVHLFLVISGFCIHMKWAKKADVRQGIDFRAFWKRRLIRLYPPYFVALLASLGLTYAFHSVLSPAPDTLGARFGFPSTAVFLTDLALLLLLLQNLSRAPWRVNNGPFWSLALEEQLYMLYFPALALRRRFGWAVTLGVAGGVSLAWRVVGLLAFEGAPPFFWAIVGPAMWLPWMLGAWAAEVYSGHQPALLSSGRWAALSLVTFAAAVPLTGGVLELAPWHPTLAWLLDDLAFGAGCFALVMAVTTHEAHRADAFAGPLWGGLARIGLWSYSLYLTHLLVMVPLKQALLRIGVGPELVMALRIVVPVAVAGAYFWIVERPAHRWARKADARRGAEAQAPAVQGARAAG
jgi:peptidoglycan/LPS O-acetylase OafA/YrhL